MECLGSWLLGMALGMALMSLWAETRRRPRP